MRVERDLLGTKEVPADAYYATVDAAGLGEQDMSVVHRVIRDQVQPLA